MGSISTRSTVTRVTLELTLQEFMALVPLIQGVDSRNDLHSLKAQILSVVRDIRDGELKNG